MIIQSYLRPILSGAALGLMLTFPQACVDAAHRALSTFATGVLPSLFPFTACMLLMTAGRSFPLPALLLLSLIGGSPSGAKILSQADLSPSLARRAARMTGTMSPMFFLGTLGMYLGHARAAQLVLGCHFAAALFFLPPLLPALRRTSVRLPALSVSAALQQSAFAMLTVGGCITLGSVGAALLGCLFPHLPFWELTILQSLMEVTSGCKALTALHPPLLLPLLAAFTSFSGFAILLQNAAFWGKSGISLTSLVFFGILRGIIAFLLCFMILLCHPGVFAL